MIWATGAHHRVVHPVPDTSVYLQCACSWLICGCAALCLILHGDHRCATCQLPWGTCGPKPAHPKSPMMHCDGTSHESPDFESSGWQSNATGCAYTHHNAIQRGKPRLSHTSPDPVRRARVTHGSGLGRRQPRGAASYHRPIMRLPGCNDCHSAAYEAQSASGSLAAFPSNRGLSRLARRGRRRMMRQ